MDELSQSGSGQDLRMTSPARIFTWIVVVDDRCSHCDDSVEVGRLSVRSKKQNI